METVLNQARIYGLFLSELREMFWIEQRIIAMPRLVQGAVRSQDLSQTLVQASLYASVRIERLRHLFDEIGETAAGIEQTVMSRLIESIEIVIMDDSPDSLAGDLPLILAVQKLFQFKMACYENLIALARIIGKKDAEEFFERNSIEDAGINILLSELSERYIYKVSASRKSSMWC